MVRLFFEERLADMPEHVVANKVKDIAESRGCFLSARLIRKISRIVKREDPPFAVKITTKGKVVIGPVRETEL